MRDSDAYFMLPVILKLMIPKAMKFHDRDKSL